MMQSRSRASVLAALVSSAMMAAVVIGVNQGTAFASVTAVRGSACGYWVNVGLAGGPQSLKGCGSGVATTDPSYSPGPVLPSGGSATTITQTDPDGATAQYGPAVLFGGEWPAAAPSAPPSGPMTASTVGTPTGGTVTSSADISLRNPPDPLSPGGFGPFPVEGDSLHVTCTATATAVTASTTITNGILVTSTNASGDPVTQEAVPVKPPVNYTRSGVITNVGDVFTAVYNEQIVNSDGSLTVNAVHMYLFGPFAVGEMVKGSATCGTTPSPLSLADTRGPSCGVPIVEPVDQDHPAAKVPRTELEGVFDNRGLQSITNIHAINATVQLGNPNNYPSPPPYLTFVPGQKGPLPIIATRTAAAETAKLPMSWSFDATDVAGNVTHCRGVQPTSLAVNDISVNEGNSGSTPATFTVTRSGDLTVASSVQYATSGGTATAGTDYTAVPLGTLSFAAGELSKTVTANVTGDTLAETNETFNLVLSAPTGGVISDTSGTATIVDNDTAFYSVSDVTVTEGNTGTTAATFTVTRSGNTAGTTTVTYSTSGGTATAGTDYATVISTTLSFSAGQTSKPVTVNVTGDTVVEPNETFNLVLATPGAGTVISDTTGTATIVDDDGTITPGPATYFSINDVRVTEGNSATTPANFTVTRSGNTTGTSTVQYKTVAGTATATSDYTTLALATLTFTAGQTTKTVSVNVVGDTVAEPNEAFTLALSTPSAGTAISDSSGTATIADDDGSVDAGGSAYLSVADMSVVEGNSATTTYSFTISRTGNFTGTSTVAYTTSGGTATAGTDYTALPLTSLTFAPGEITKVVNVNVIGDAVVEPNETFNLVLSVPGVGTLISDTTATATIVNDD